MEISTRTAPLRNPTRANRMLWGTIGYLFLFIFRPFEYWEWLGEWRIERVYMICLLVALFSWKGKRYVHHSITNAFLGFFLVICVSIFIAYRPEEAIRTAEDYLKLLVLYFVIILTVRDEKDFRTLITAFIAITGIYVGKSMWEFFVHGRHFYRMGIVRLVGIDQTYNDPNSFAATVVYSLPFAWALWKTDWSIWVRRAMVGYGAMSVVAIMFTGSRSGMVSFLLFLALVFLRGNKKVIASVAMLISLLLIWQIVPNEYRLRYLTIFDDSINQSATESAQGRVDGLKNGLKLFSARPITGWGASNFPFAVETIGVYNRMHSHNLYGQLAADLGLLGIIPFFGVCWRIYRTSRNIYKYKTSSSVGISRFGGRPDFIPAISIACLNILILLLFEGLFGHNLYRYTWLIIGAILVLGQSFRSNRFIAAVGLPSIKTPGRK